MKSAILTLATILSSIGLANAQNQLSFKADTAATPKLGFNKQSQWSLPLKDSIVIRDYDFRSPENKEPNLATSSYNMPIVEPDGKHTMPVHFPDTTVTYKKQVFNID